MKEQIQNFLKEHNISMEYVFIPFKQSINCKDSSKSWYDKPNWASLNWECTLRKNGLHIITEHYGQGIGHIPGYQSNCGRGYTIHEAGIISETINTGVVPWRSSLRTATPGKVPKLSIVDVLFSLLIDGNCYFDGYSFEDWAENYGYEIDSREAEVLYRHCMEVGRKLQATLGTDLINELRELYQDY